MLVANCTSKEGGQHNATKYPPAENDLPPMELAQAYCGSCHLYPEPDLLSKPVWDKVLKNMGSRLGVESEDYDPFHRLSMYDAFILRQVKTYPEDSLIGKKHWQAILKYYSQHAPDKPIPQIEKTPVTHELPGFKLTVVDDLPAQALSTLVKIDTSTKSIYWGSRMGDLMLLNSSGKLINQTSLESPPSQMLLEAGEAYVLTMGVMDPSEESLGKLLQIRNRALTEVLSGLQRPVNISKTDGGDYVVSEFGNQTGKLSWFSQDPSGQFNPLVISNVPGAVKTVLHDFNSDSMIDVMALFGQGDERISIFFQQAPGKFKEQVILRFPPVYGSGNFQLIDINDDQQMDILYTNGDNADYSYALKNYHGVRIFINQGGYQYTEAFFYPLFGATKSMAKDFDLDGDLDIFTICFFPDFDADFPEGFVYFENQGNMKFAPQTFPESVNGRWLVADAGDVDGDGDPDIVLGSLLFRISAAPQQLIDRWTEYGYQMVILENTAL